jgi:hypothetical protein
LEINRKTHPTSFSRFLPVGASFASLRVMAKRAAKKAERAVRELARIAPPPKNWPQKDDKKRTKKNKIHVSLFIDGEEVTLLDEFNAPGEAIAACREFLDKHWPKVTQSGEEPRASSSPRSSH